MTSAKEVLDERLAKGEITHEEYDRITSKLSLDSRRGLKRDWWWAFLAIGAGGCAFMFVMAAPYAAQGVRFNDLGIFTIGMFSLIGVFGIIKLVFGN